MNQNYPTPGSPSPDQEDNQPERAIPGAPSGQRVAVNLPEVRPYVTYTILGLTILVFLLQLASEYLLGRDIPSILGMKANEAILQGQLWRLFTPMLLHGSILHLAFNMYALNIFGPTLERSFGHGRFLALYLLSGFAGNVISFFFSPALSLGSSTAIFGLLGAEGVFLYLNRELFGRSAQRALSSIITVAVINLIIGLSPGIDNWGHVGGLLGGTLFTWLGGPRLQVEGVYPSISLVDQRDTSDVIRAGFAVGLLFLIITLGAFYLHGGM